jgi:ribosomal-protein-alanine N-acetyltransferase
VTDYIFTCDRLGFRQWNDSDFDVFYKMCSDSKVMEYFPSTLSKLEVKRSIERFKDNISSTGIGFFAVDILASNEFIGFIGAKHQTMEVDFTPCVEIGWRLKRTSWGFGYATEGAAACLKYLFDNNITEEVYSFAPVQNKKSERVMINIGMQHMGFFNHPFLKADSNLLSHNLYHIAKQQFSKNEGI